MIKVYLDWNVMSAMKSNRLDEFRDIILNKTKFLLIYSTAHIGDIFASVKNHSIEEQEMIRADLDYIRFLTNNLCIYNNSDQIIVDRSDPGELLDQRIEQAPMFNNLSIDSLFPTFEDEPILNIMTNAYKNLISSLPIDDAIKQAYDNPEGSEMMDKMFPGLKEDLTIDGLFKSFGKMLKNLNEEEGYKELREAVQKAGINSGHFNDDKNPFDVISKAYKKLGIEDFDINKPFENSKNAPKWFNEIVNEYVVLDIHGYKSDKVKVNAKEKKTFKNTTEDAFHTAFASKCEFYITNDNKNYLKAKAVYNKLGINTKVLKTEEFIKYFNEYLNYNNLAEHFTSIINVIKKGEGFKQQDYEDGSVFGLVKFTNEYFFNFFNKLLMPKPEESDSFFILSKENPATSFVICYEEIVGVIKLFVDELGADIKDQGCLMIDEIKKDEDWEGRSWETNLGSISIFRVNTWFHLHYKMNDQKK
ncbi:hypothetical protein [Yeosuana marina]|uniref:hypothetical protein n=1 Tax=Yeosuana marina TaxID=1565536 RepID=UPI0030EDBC8B